jgi:hypothetical protein
MTVLREGQETAEETNARAAASPTLANAVTMALFASPGAVPDVTMLAEAFRAAADRVRAGDLSDVTAMLLSKAMTGNAISADMYRRARLNTNNLDAFETFMRLGLKADAQSRAACVELAEIVNPRPVFINPRQVNHTNGPQQINNATGPQQVNNGDPQPASLPDRSDEQA